ncbi:MAG: DNA topology modulation protein FlaR [Clostridia bacterium]|nr:DNA topology modulation protein FlaR [Clostridia bacterium]
MKIAVLGYAGSGKTYLSDYMAQKKKIPVLHLDDIKWNKEWKPIDDSVVLPAVTDFMNNEDWIIDGYYEYLLLEERLESADKIILLQLPRMTCFCRAVKRSKTRKAAGYVNDMNSWFIKFLLFGCRDKARRHFYNKTAKKYKYKTVVLKTKRQVEEFIKTV